MTSRRALPSLAAVVLLSVPAWVSGDDPRMVLEPKKAPEPVTVNKSNEPGVVTGSRLESMTARVKSIDRDRREVTLRGSGGREETIKLGPEVKNLERLEVGDRVTIRYRAGIVLRLQAPDAEDVAPESTNEIERAGRGNALSGIETVRARGTVTVVSIDATSRVVTLKGANGRTYLVKAGPEVPLERVKVGDKVTATYSAALAVSVEPTYRE